MGHEPKVLGKTDLLSGETAVNHKFSESCQRGDLSLWQESFSDIDVAYNKHAIHCSIFTGGRYIYWWISRL